MKRDRKKTKVKNCPTRDYCNSKELALPTAYVPGFLGTLDKRGMIYKAIIAERNQIADDMGGEDSLSAMRISLIERYAFLNLLLRNIEHAILSEPMKKVDKRLARHLSIVKVLRTLAVTLGIERQARPAERLEAYLVDEPKKKKKKKGKK